MKSKTVVAYGQKFGIVFAAALIPVRGVELTRAALIPPLPFSPWHAAHFCANTREPSAGVPLPAGKPLPSGRMLMSHAATSACVIGLPRFGPSARASPALKTIAITIPPQTRSRVNMFDLSLGVDRPARDAV